MGMSLSLSQLAYLDQVRGFIAVGRRMSITRAAEDLCLTQSAVSRQILTLEEQLGVKLLIRGYRSISFSEAGERLFRSADGMMQNLQDVMGEIRSRGANRPVALSASIGVTGLWLLPRLNAFQRLHPGIDVRISANNRVGDLHSDGIDLAIRYTTEKLAPTGSVRLFNESIAPVAHPSLGVKLGRSKQLPLKWPLLEFDGPQKQRLKWREWLSAEEWTEAKQHGVLHFNQYDQVIQAAMAGQGIALGRLELIQPLLDEGQLMLVAPGKTGGKSSHAYWLVRVDERPSSDVQRVENWIQDEALKTLNWKPR